MHYLRTISSQDDSWCSLIKDDPVRPEIPLDSRIGQHAEIMVLINEQDEPGAAVCVKYCSRIPSTVDEMLEDHGDLVAVFYTIWSYSPGAGGRLVLDAKKHIESRRTSISRFVTLSPKTAMAERFHVKNGAIVLSRNEKTVNYEYL